MRYRIKKSRPGRVIIWAWARTNRRWGWEKAKVAKTLKEAHAWVSSQVNRPPLLQFPFYSGGN